jgi:hypothetical protein
VRGPTPKLKRYRGPACLAGRPTGKIAEDRGRMKKYFRLSPDK